MFKKEIISSLGYKELQQKCKEHKLKAVGTKEVLQTRLTDYFSTGSNNKIDDITNSLKSLNINTTSKLILFEKLNPSNVAFDNEDVEEIYYIAIIIYSKIKQNINILYINDILNEFLTLRQNCNIPKDKLILFINGITSLFYEEIETNTNTKEEALNGLMEGALYTCNKHNIKPNIKPF